MNTLVMVASNSEKLFYEIASATDQMSLAVATLKIPSVAREGSSAYWELINASAARRMDLEQQRMAAKN